MQFHSSKFAGIPVNIGKLAPGARATTVFIAVQDKASKRWIANGTAFPICMNSQIFLVSAAHNFTQLEDEPLLLMGEKGTLRLYRHNFVLMGSTEMDLALLAIPSKDLLELFGECNCVVLDAEAQPSRKGTFLYQAYGYPTSKNKHSNIDGWKRHEFRISLGPDARPPIRSRLHQIGSPLLGFYIDPKQLIDDEGVQDKQLGKLDGLSGGPVLCHPIENGKMGPGKIAGIFLEWHGADKVAVAMPARAIISAVNAWFP